MHEITRRTQLGLASFIAALASLGAGSIHLAVAPDHWRAWTLYGVFFLGIALFQVIWAAAVLLVAHQVVPALGLVANIAAVALWGVTRAWGPPIGPDAGTPEAIGVPGVLTVVLEVVAAVGALMLLVPRRQPAALGRGGDRFALGGAVLAIAALTTPGVIAAFGHSHGSHGEHAGHHETRPREPGHSDHHAPAAPPPVSGTLPAPPPPTEGESGHGHHDH